MTYEWFPTNQVSGMIIDTGSMSRTMFITPLRVMYPCRCGTMHAIKEDYLQHECMHESGLGLIGDDQAVCADCGKVFNLKREQ